MTQLMLFSTLNTSGVDSTPLDFYSRYDYQAVHSYEIENVQVKKESVRCDINGRNYLIDGFKYVESALIWNYLYNRMIDKESNYHEFSWKEMCREIGIDMDESMYDVVMKPLLRSCVSEQVRRMTFRCYRTFNALSQRIYADGELRFALTLSSGFCSLDGDFQQAIYRVLIENCQKSFSTDDIESIRNIGRRKYRLIGHNRMSNLQFEYDVATA